MTAEDKRRRAACWLLPLGLVLISVLLFLIVWFIRAADRKVTEYKEAAYEEQLVPRYNRFGLRGNESPSTRLIKDTGDALIFSDRVVNKLAINEDADLQFSLRMQALRALVGEDARIAAIPVPKRIQFEPDYMEESNEIYGLLMDELASELPADIRLMNVYGDLAADETHLLFYRTQDCWTMDGAYYGYKAACSALGLTPFDIDHFNYYNVNNFSGTLKEHFVHEYQDSDLVMEMIVRDISGDPFIFRYASGFKNYEIAFDMRDDVEYKRPVIIHSIGGNDAIIGATLRYAKLFGNGSGSLMVLADSTGKYIIPYLTEHYENIISVDVERCDTEVMKELIIEYNISDFVVTQAVDRVGRRAYSKTLNGLLG